MSLRFSLSNIFLPVSHGQFVNYCTEFKVAVEQSFGASCAITIAGYKRLKSYITIIDNDLQTNCNDINQSNEIFKVSSLQDVSTAMWRKARYVDVNLIPKGKENALQYAFAHMEFKGGLKNTATFYMQPGDEGVRSTMKSKNRFKLEGDGYDQHGDVNGFMGGRGGLFAMGWN